MNLKNQLNESIDWIKSITDESFVESIYHLLDENSLSINDQILSIAVIIYGNGIIDGVENLQNAYSWSDYPKSIINELKMSNAEIPCDKYARMIHAGKPLSEIKMQLQKSENNNDAH